MHLVLSIFQPDDRLCLMWEWEPDHQQASIMNEIERKDRRAVEEILGEKFTSEKKVIVLRDWPWRWL